MSQLFDCVVILPKTKDQPNGRVKGAHIKGINHDGEHGWWFGTFRFSGDDYIVHAHSRYARNWYLGLPREWNDLENH